MLPTAAAPKPTHDAAGLLDNGTGVSGVDGEVLIPGIGVTAEICPPPAPTNATAVVVTSNIVPNPLRVAAICQSLIYPPPPPTPEAAVVVIDGTGTPPRISLIDSITLLRDFPTDATKLLSPLDDISVYTGVSLDNQIIAFRLGGVSLVVAALTLHAENAAVALRACKAIFGLCDRNVENKKELQKLKGVSALVATLRRHLNNEDVVAPACAALQCVSSFRVASGTLNGEEVVEAGGIPLLLAVLRTHARSSAAITTSGCGTLRNITISDPTAVREMLSLDGAAVVLSSLQLHADDPLVVRSAVTLLESLARFSQDNAMAIAQTGAISIVVPLWRHFLNVDYETHSACNDLLDTLSEYPALKNAVEEAGFKTLEGWWFRFWRSLVWLFNG